MRANKAGNRPAFSLLLFFAPAVLLAASFGCAPSSTPGGEGSPAAENGSLPELTDDLIQERINEVFIRDIPEETGAAEPINWNFNHDEPKEITVVERKMDGPRATLILDVKTRSSPNMRNPRSLAGRMRTEWRLQTGWVLRKWEITDAENISIKYKNLPKPPEPSPSPKQ